MTLARREARRRAAGSTHIAACFPGAAIGEARFRPNHASAATPAHNQVHINGQKLVSGACVKKNKNGTTNARATASLNPAIMTRYSCTSGASRRCREMNFAGPTMSGVMCNKAVQPSPAIAKRGCSLEAQIIDGYRLALAVRRQCRFVSFDALLELAFTFAK